MSILQSYLSLNDGKIKSDNEVVYFDEWVLRESYMAL